MRTKEEVVASKTLAGLGVLGVFGALLSLVVAIDPEPLIAMMDWESRAFLWASTVDNLGWALVLFVAAPVSRAPGGFRLLAVLALVEAILYPLLPADAWAAYIRWWTVDHLTFYRFGGGAMGLLLSGFLIYGALPARPDTAGS